MTGVGLKVSTLLVRTKLSMPTEMNTAHLFNDNIVIGYQDFMCSDILFRKALPLFAKKILSSFCSAKLLTFFPQKYWHILALLYYIESTEKHMKIFERQRSRSFLITYFDQSNLNSSNTFFLKDNGHILTRFYMEPPGARWMGFCSGSPDHMTNMATIPLYGQIL